MWHSLYPPVYREDINSWKNTTGNHGFDFKVHTNLTGNVKVIVWSSNGATGSSKMIEEIVVRIDRKSGYPVGVVEGSDKHDDGTITIWGWSYIPGGMKIN